MAEAGDCVLSLVFPIPVANLLLALRIQFPRATSMAVEEGEEGASIEDKAEVEEAAGARSSPAPVWAEEEDQGCIADVDCP